jgi:hypothetical protein
MNSTAQQLPVVGTEYHLTSPVERFPHFTARKNMTGIVTEATEEFISLRLTQTLAGAEEWDNEIFWSADDCFEVIDGDEDDHYVSDFFRHCAPVHVEHLKSNGDVLLDEEHIGHVERVGRGYVGTLTDGTVVVENADCKSTAVGRICRTRLSEGDMVKGTGRGNTGGPYVLA